jgi:general stress protein CsbA
MTTDTEKADAVSRRRAQYMPFLAVALLAQQSLFVSWDGRTVTLAQTAAWIVLALVVLFAIVTGGNWFANPRVRQLANDEVTRANRAKAIVRGFIAAMLTAVLVFAVSPIEPITAQRAAHLIVSIGLAVTLLVFGLEERKSL